MVRLDFKVHSSFCWALGLTLVQMSWLKPYYIILVSTHEACLSNPFRIPHYRQILTCVCDWDMLALKEDNNATMSTHNPNPTGKNQHPDCHMCCKSASILLLNDMSISSSPWSSHHQPPYQVSPRGYHWPKAYQLHALCWSRYQNEVSGNYSDVA